MKRKKLAISILYISILFLSISLPACITPLKDLDELRIVSKLSNKSGKLQLYTAIEQKSIQAMAYSFDVNSLESTYKQNLEKFYSNLSSFDKFKYKFYPWDSPFDLTLSINPSTLKSLKVSDWFILDKDGDEITLSNPLPNISHFGVAVIKYNLDEWISKNIYANSTLLKYYTEGKKIYWLQYGNVYVEDGVGVIIKYNDSYYLVGISTKISNQTSRLSTINASFSMIAVPEPYIEGATNITDTFDNSKAYLTNVINLSKYGLDYLVTKIKDKILDWGKPLLTWNYFGSRYYSRLKLKYKEQAVESAIAIVCENNFTRKMLFPKSYKFLKDNFDGFEIVYKTNSGSIWHFLDKYKSHTCHAPFTDPEDQKFMAKAITGQCNNEQWHEVAGWGFHDEKAPEAVKQTDWYNDIFKKELKNILSLNLTLSSDFGLVFTFNDTVGATVYTPYQILFVGKEFFSSAKSWVKSWIEKFKSTMPTKENVTELINKTLYEPVSRAEKYLISLIYPNSSVAIFVTYVSSLPIFIANQSISYIASMYSTPRKIEGIINIGNYSSLTSFNLKAYFSKDKKTWQAVDIYTTAPSSSFLFSVSSSSIPFNYEDGDIIYIKLNATATFGATTLYDETKIYSWKVMEDPILKYLSERITKLEKRLQNIQYTIYNHTSAIDKVLDEIREYLPTDKAINNPNKKSYTIKLIVKTEKGKTFYTSTQTIMLGSNDEQSVYWDVPIFAKDTYTATFYVYDENNNLKLQKSITINEKPSFTERVKRWWYEEEHWWDKIL